MIKTWVCFLMLVWGLVTFSVTESAAEDTYVSLQQSLENFAQSHNGVIGVSFTDLTTNHHIGVQDDIRINPASVIKVPVMVEVFRQVLDGRISLQDKLEMKRSDVMGGSGFLFRQKVGSSYTIRYLTEIMITHSDNTATKLLIDHLGAARINKTMRDLGLKDTVIGTSNLLRAEGLNYSSPRDMNMLLTQIYRGSILDADRCHEMVDIMSRQHHKWGIPKYLPGTLRIANKTGTLNYVKNDSGIVFFEGRPYVLSVFTTKKEAKAFGKTWIPQVSRIVYDWCLAAAKEI
jgi:beta-lactamase class A